MKSYSCKDRMCGADDCRTCHPESFVQGVYMEGEVAQESFDRLTAIAGKLAVELAESLRSLKGPESGEVRSVRLRRWDLIERITDRLLEAIEDAAEIGGREE